MLLHRYAMMTFPVAIPSVARWGYVTAEGVGVYVNAVQGANEPPAQTSPGIKIALPQALPVASPTQVLLHAEAPTDFEVVEPYQMRVAEEPRQSAERALSEMAAILGILAETQWTLASPRPYLMVSAETDEERALVRQTKRLILPRHKVSPPYRGQRLSQSLDVARILADRIDGVLLLGAAQRAGHGIGKLHELFRVLENGFGCAGGQLVGPLTSFLATYPWDLGYSRSEVRDWVYELRHPATHADLARSTRIAHDSDVERHLFRIEQAAYDVLFNKSTWNRSDAGRTMRRAFDAAQTADGGAVVADSPILRADQTFDHFGTFPLSERIRLQTENLDDDWLVGDWYFSEEDWKAMGAQ